MKRTIVRAIAVALLAVASGTAAAEAWSDKSQGPSASPRPSG